MDQRRQYFQDWYEAVSTFTARNLTFHTDKLPADHMILESHMKRAQVAFGNFGRDTRYLPSNVSTGRWPGVLVQEKEEVPGEGEIIGFIALDSDPATSSVKIYDLAILLMREDDKHTANLSMAKNGKMGYYSSDKVPLVFDRLPNGNISFNLGSKRYLTGLALQKVPDVGGLTIFQRVGMCQLY